MTQIRRRTKNWAVWGTDVTPSAETPSETAMPGGNHRDPIVHRDGSHGRQAGPDERLPLLRNGRLHKQWWLCRSVCILVPSIFGQ